MSDLDGIACCRLVVRDFLTRLILHDPFIKLWSYEHHTFRKFLKFGMRGCKMEHSKQFLGVMLCPSVQQPQREKIPHSTCRFESCVNYNRSSSFVRTCTIWKCLSRRVHACSKNWNCIWFQQVWLHQFTNFCSVKPTFQNFVASRVRARAILRDLKCHYWSWVLSIMIRNKKKFFEIYEF